MSRKYPFAERRHPWFEDPIAVCLSEGSPVQMLGLPEARELWEQIGGALLGEGVMVPLSLCPETERGGTTEAGDADVLCVCCGCVVDDDGTHTWEACASAAVERERSSINRECELQIEKDGFAEEARHLDDRIVRLIASVRKLRATLEMLTEAHEKYGEKHGSLAMGFERAAEVMRNTESDCEPSPMVVRLVRFLDEIDPCNGCRADCAECPYAELREWLARLPTKSELEGVQLSKERKAT